MANTTPVTDEVGGSGADTHSLVVLLGNPNTGKSTLFNALAGLSQRTGNYPGVTVEKKSGQFQSRDRTFEVVDLPGTYSLAPHTPDEMLSVNVLLGRPPLGHEPDVIVCVVDASNLERNLFLVSQVLDLNRPTVVAMNMTDVAVKRKLVIDAERLGELLGVTVVPIQANRRRGLEQLKQAIAGATEQEFNRIHDPFEPEIRARIERLMNACPSDCKLKRFALTRMLFDSDGYMVRQMQDLVDQNLQDALTREQQEMRAAGDFSTSESASRYSWIKRQLAESVQQTDPDQRRWTDRVDSVLTHPLSGLLIAAVVMVMVFQVVFWAAEPASNAIDWLTGAVTGVVDQLFIRWTGAADGVLYSLIVDGLIAGVGGVLVFLPQIVMLFMILAILEDSGYLSRAAFLTDKYLSRLGLSGITLIPLLSSFACAIPGVMATRVIKNERERLVTILIAPLMSCSARLPVYTLLIAAFVPAGTFWGFGYQGLTMFAMYMVGIVVAIGVAFVLKKTILKFGTSSFVMELPEYKVPSLRSIARRMYDGGWAFVKDAGTVIVAATILVWAAAYFPRTDAQLTPGLLDRQAQLESRLADGDTLGDQRESVESELALVSNQIDSEYLRNSFLGRAGRMVEPVVKPLGWDWRIGSAAIASFPAREVIVSTMGVLFGLGGDVDEESESLRASIVSATWDGTDRPLFTLPVALSIMVFFALCAQCVSTLAVIKRETNSWGWPVFTFVYMTVLAYVAALITFQVASRMVV